VSFFGFNLNPQKSSKLLSCNISDLQGSSFGTFVAILFSPEPEKKAKDIEKI